jgi:hypothetical protein
MRHRRISTEMPLAKVLIFTAQVICSKGNQKMISTNLKYAQAETRLARRLAGLIKTRGSVGSLNRSQSSNGVISDDA